MPKRMLIDASHPEETRVVVLDGNRVEEFDFEAASKRPLKGNIYLAKVTRVEPSLQAAFVEYGGNRQGFLAFSEIHPDYYQIPVADRLALLEAQTQRLLAEEEDIDRVDIGTPAQDTARSSERTEEYIQHSEEPRETREAQAPSQEVSETPERISAEDAAVDATPSVEMVETETAEAVEDEESSEDEETSENEATDSEDEPVEADEETELEEPPAESIPSPPVAEIATPEPAPAQAESTGAPQSFRRHDHRDRPRLPRRRQYKIQEVIKRRQIMLVQVVKEERGNKGASLTTFLSLAGRYCVLMPNTPRGGGISRKITNATDRKRLKSAAQSLELPEGMGLIIRTAGANRTKLEIKRDYEYLLRLWDTVRELTLKSNAPALVYEEGSLIKRAIRDLYNKDTAEILVDGEAGYRDAKDFMRMLMPSHAKNVKLYKEALPLFQRYQVESQLDAMFSPVVTLRSGGYIVINQTEALVSIDVNSGKATREHSIEETAHKTNLEAADEIARQLRLRDLAGLIVIDFIDMEDGKNDRNVEKRLYNAVRGDRARIQIGKISQFGLLEMSRQRLRAGVVAGSTITCPHCNGQGIIRSTESAALRLLRALDEEGQHGPSANLTIKAPPDVTIYTLNQKRREIARIEEAYNLGITFDPQANMMGGSFEIERTGARAPVARPKAAPVSVEGGFDVAAAPETEQAEPEAVEPVEEETEPVSVQQQRGQPQQQEHAQQPGIEGEGGGRRRRRRRRRGGRGRHEGGMDSRNVEPQHQQGEPRHEAPLAMEAASREGAQEPTSAAEPNQQNGTQPPLAGENGEKRRRRRRRGRRGRRREGEFGNAGSNPQMQQRPQSEYAYQNKGGENPRPRFENSPELVEANAPSSPQWSLSEHVRAAEPPEETRSSRPEQSTVVEMAVSEHHEEDSAAPASEPASDEPKEARKGWWQRRFKI